MTQKAIDKLNEEFKQMEKLSQKGNAVKDYVLETLINFCNQNAEFAQAVVQSDKTIAECIESTVKDSGSSISDLEVYKKAVSFYFPGATIKFDMRIDLGDEGFSNVDGTNSNELRLSIDNLLDF